MRRQREQCRLYVRRRFAAAELAREPVEVEGFASGTFRRCAPEIGVGQQLRKETRDDAAAPAPRAVVVEWLLEMTLRPGIEQKISWSTVESADRTGGWQIGQVGDSAEVDNHAMHVAACKHRVVKRWHDRRALASGRQIAAAKIAYHVNTSQLGEQRPVNELNAVAGGGLM